MVKLKEGYVMSAREKEEYERLDALPRKPFGRVDYYYKPQTKYPPRIYVYMHSEIWCDRNRRPMGLYYAVPFLTRPMNKEEIEYHHFDHRLCYHQYENWTKLIYAEEQEAEALDREQPGNGTAFLEKLKSFQGRYSLARIAEIKTSPPAADGEDELKKCIRELLDHGSKMTAREIGAKLDGEHQGAKRLPMLILLRELYKNIVKEEKDKIWIDGSLLDRKVWLSQERTRKNFVRRVYTRNKLFAIAEIQSRYPDYSEAMLLSDLAVKRKAVKRSKRKTVLDLRRCQLAKLANRLTSEELGEKEYQQTCNRIAMLQHAHDQRLPVPLTVTIEKVTLVYNFHWRTRETVVKSFVTLANTKGITHEQLGNRHDEMSRSAYSY